MGRGNTDLSSNEYDCHLAQKAKTSRSARQELQQRNRDKKYAHDSSGVGWHFNIGDKPVKIESKEHLRAELDKRGLMLRADVRKDLK